MSRTEDIFRMELRGDGMGEMERDVMTLINDLKSFEKYWERALSKHRNLYEPDILEIFKEAQNAVYEAQSALEQAADYLEDFS